LAIAAISGQVVDSGDATRGAAWIQPVGIALITRSSDEVYLSGGFNIPFGQQRSLAVELAYLRIHGGTGPKPWFSGVVSDESFWEWDYGILTVGPSLELDGGGRPLEGPFIQPKAIIALLRSRLGYGGLEFPARDITTFGIGLEAGIDVGYHLRFDPIYLAPVLGLSVGAGRGVPLGLLGMYPMELGGPVGRALKFDLNVNLLRIGAVF
jgi:hypothetical protein